MRQTLFFVRSFVVTSIVLQLKCEEFNLIKHGLDLNPVVQEVCQFRIWCPVLSTQRPQKVIWLKDGLKTNSGISELKSELNREGLHLFILTFEHINLADGGNYTCVVKNKRIGNQTASISYNVKVVPKGRRRWCEELTYPPFLQLPNSPWLISPPNFKLVTKSSSAIIDCLPKYNQDRDILSWQLPNGTFLSHGNNTLDGFLVFPNGSLQIRSMKIEAQGFYSCVIGEGFNTSTDVYIPMSAKISRLPLNFEAPAGCSFRLKCAAAGDEPLDLNIRIPRGSRSTGKISSSATRFHRDLVYELNNVQEPDGGVYECEAKNSFGPMSRTTVRLDIGQPLDSGISCPSADVLIEDLAKYERPYRYNDIDNDLKEANATGRFPIFEDILLMALVIVCVNYISFD